jgi:hypothetical protein
MHQAGLAQLNETTSTCNSSRHIWPRRLTPDAQLAQRRLAARQPSKPRAGILQATGQTVHEFLHRITVAFVRPTSTHAHDINWSGFNWGYEVEQ